MNSNSFYGLGRRKSAVAKVYLTHGSGQGTIVYSHNGQVEKTMSFDDYFPSKSFILDLMTPLRVLHQNDQFDVTTIVKGGGYAGQAGAIRLGIARALLTVNNEWKPLLKKQSLTTRDARVKERKKFGKYGARRSPQFTKR